VGAAGATPTMGVVVESRTDARSTSRLAHLVAWSSTRHVAPRRSGASAFFAGAGILALGLYGFVVTFQPDPHFALILAAYGGVSVAGSPAWGMLIDGVRPDRSDLLGAARCLAAVAVIIDAPRAS
jgi:small multidrug resistance family-3 protein